MVHVERGGLFHPNVAMKHAPAFPEVGWSAASVQVGLAATMAHQPDDSATRGPPRPPWRGPFGATREEEPSELLQTHETQGMCRRETSEGRVRLRGRRWGVSREAEKLVGRESQAQEAAATLYS